jgi:hypothetical protein
MTWTSTRYLDVTLPDEVFAHAERIAEERTARDRAAGRRHKRRAKDESRGTHPGKTKDWLGAMGECAACLPFGLDPLVEVKSDKPDPGWDFMLGRRTVDVKTSGFPRMRLYVDRVTAYAYVLVWPTDDERVWRIAGFCLGREFEAISEPWTSETGRTTRRARHERLKPISELAALWEAHLEAQEAAQA